MHISFGLDLAGFSGGNTAIVKAVRDGDRIDIAVLAGHCFANCIDGDRELSDVTESEVKCIQQMLDAGFLFIDVPIDLQGLPLPRGAKYIWQLSKRPVDRAFIALSPLADRIGSSVARMQNLWTTLRRDRTDPLNVKMFETYPAASLRLNELVSQGYKGSCRYASEQWVPNDAEVSADKILAELLNVLGWVANEGFVLTNDEFDASLCALVAFGENLHGEELDRWISRRLGAEYRSPHGYALVRQIPRDVKIRREAFDVAIRKSNRNKPLGDWEKGFYDASIGRSGLIAREQRLLKALQSGDCDPIEVEKELRFIREQLPENGSADD